MHRSRELRQHFERITDDPVICGLEERRFRIGVDDDNGLGLVHPGEVLDGTGDTRGDVQIGTNGDARLAHVLVVRAPPDVRNRTGASEQPSIFGS